MGCDHDNRMGDFVFALVAALTSGGSGTVKMLRHYIAIDGIQTEGTPARL